MIRGWREGLLSDCRSGEEWMNINFFDHDHPVVKNDIGSQIIFVAWQIKPKKPTCNYYDLSYCLLSYILKIRYMYKLLGFLNNILDGEGILLEFNSFIPSNHITSKSFDFLGEHRGRGLNPGLQRLYRPNAALCTHAG